MGNPKAFLTIRRKEAGYRPINDRIHDFGEVEQTLNSNDRRLQASRCMDCGVPFCHWACPLGNKPPEWNEALYRGDWELAYRLLVAPTPFPEFTGRICPALCEKACVLNLMDHEPTTNREDEAAIAEHAFNEDFVRVETPVRNGKRVAVIGAGPAGLAAANDLNHAGCSVTVYEQHEAAGGLLRYGIPNFKLNKAVIDRRMAFLEKEGITFRYGEAIDLNALPEGYDAYVVATGTPQARALDIPGRDLKGLLCAWFMNTIRTLWAWSWLLSVFFAIVIALTLGSYSLNDPSFSVSTGRTPENFCGALGAWTADLMLSAFGFSAWWFVLGSAMIGFFAIRTAWRRMKGETDPLRINPPKITAAVGFLAVLVGSTCLEALRLRRFQMILPGEPGGILGDSLAWGIRHYIGVGLSTVLFVSLIAVGLSLLMDFQWGDVAERIGRFICCWFIDPVARLLKTKRREEGLAPQDEPETVDTDASIVPIVRVVDDATPPAAFVEPLARADACSASVPASAGPAVQAAPRASKHADCPLSMSLLDEPPAHREANSADDLQMTGRLIVSKLKSYGIEASIGGIQPGPVITQYWLEPGPGVKGSQIDNVRDDLRRTLGVQAVRVVPSIPNTSFIGLEVPNPVRETVRLKEILESKAFRESTAPLTLALGKDIGGKAFVVDLAKMPHLLVAGTTGAG